MRRVEGQDLFDRLRCFEVCAIPYSCCCDGGDREGKDYCPEIWGGRHVAQGSGLERTTIAVVK